MNKTPQSLRLQVGLFGRVNTGKSSLLNYITGQDAALASPVPGTTTDVVRQAMELLPLGPVLFLDTAGSDDLSELGAARSDRTAGALRQADVVVVVVEAGVWGPPEQALVEAARARKAGLIVVVNKCDLKAPEGAFLDQLKALSPQVLCASAVDADGRQGFLERFKTALALAKPRGAEPPLLTVAPGHDSACIHHDRLPSLAGSAATGMAR